MAPAKSTPQVTFITQNAPIDEYGRALYAVARSILRAYIDSISDEDLRDINTELGHVDKWRSQRRIDVMSMKPKKLSAVLS